MAMRALPPLVFGLVAAAPLALLSLGAQSGAWLWVAVGHMAVLTVVLDRLIPLAAGDAPEGAEFPAADAVLAVLGLGAVAALPLATWAVAGESGLSGAERAAAFVATGLWLGQVAHPAAHELIHRGHRALFGLGRAVYVMILFGQHASAHRLVHHRMVASAQDPNSARAGEGFYRFARRAWVGSFRQGWAAEDALRAGGGGRGLHPYALYIGGGVAALALAFAIAGLAGVAVWAGLALHAQSQLLVSDYVQHYGLTRATLPNGKLEPVGPAHSWNAAAWYSSALTLNAPRHSDHHSHPQRPYPALRLGTPDTAPRLPWPLPVACAIAFVPRLWMRRMRPHLARWHPPGPATPPRAEPGLPPDTAA